MLLRYALSQDELGCSHHFIQTDASSMASSSSAAEPLTPASHIPPPPHLPPQPHEAHPSISTPPYSAHSSSSSLPPPPPVSAPSKRSGILGLTLTARQIRWVNISQPQPSSVASDTAMHVQLSYECADVDVPCAAHLASGVVALCFVLGFTWNDWNDEEKVSADKQPARQERRGKGEGRGSRTQLLLEGPTALLP